MAGPDLKQLPADKKPALPARNTIPGMYRGTAGTSRL